MSDLHQTTKVIHYSELDSENYTFLKDTIKNNNQIMKLLMEVFDGDIETLAQVEIGMIRRFVKQLQVSDYFKPLLRNLSAIQTFPDYMILMYD